MRLKSLLADLQEELAQSPSAVLMPLRAVLTGKARSRSVYGFIIGKERTLKRVKNTYQKYKKE